MVEGSSPSGRATFLLSESAELSKKNNLKGLPYYGGKSPGYGTGPWIASHLPQGKTYVEAFAGMAGVLLSRPPITTEVLNDADGHLVNWWKMVRDKPKEMNDLVAKTPISRQIYNESHDALMSGELDDDPLRRALAYHVCIQQGFVKGLGRKGWGATYVDKGGKKHAFNKEHIPSLAKRMRNVYLECCAAEKIIKNSSPYKDLVLYLDPPYVSANTGGYLHKEFDVAKLTELVKKCKGFVAISGYGEEWDHLEGWHRHEYKTIGRTNWGKKSAQEKERIEVLWTNKPAASNHPKTELGV